MNRLTDFFIAQRYYRRMSQWFYGLFLLAILVQFALLALIVGLISRMVTGEFGVGVFLWLMAIFASYLLIGMLISRQRVKYGGMSIAKQSKAVRLFVYQGDDDEADKVVFSDEFIRVAKLSQFPDSYRRYYEFASQMAIASGVPLPRLYVLPFETGVNGFVAGFDSSDMVMVLTQGAVEKLSNAELYGVIGHEFGHIIHGDARLNLRMYVMLTTLGWLYDSVDVFEEWIFGRFDKDYHRVVERPQSPTASTDLSGIGDKQAWIAYLKQDRQERENFYLQDRQGVFGLPYQNHKRDSYYDDAQAHALAVYLMMAFPMVVVRLFGVWGMLSAEWVKQQFNHQREFLADATSVQLTRSPAVVEALESLAYKYPTRLYHQGFSTCMGHFFFAEPNSDHALHSHPKLSDRIDAVEQGVHLSFACEMTADMDKDKLRTAHERILAYHYDPKTADAPEPESLPEPAPDSIEFYAVPERVIDGRLVIEDWRETDKTQTALYPKHATPLTQIEPQLSEQGHLRYSQLKAVNLPWHITKGLRNIIGTLALYECLQACQSDMVYTHKAVGFDEIYGLPLMSVLPHELPDELLTAVARHDRRLDGLLSQVALKRLLWHFNNPISDKQKITLKNYHTGLSEFIAHARHDKTDHAGTVFNHDIMADNHWHGTLSDLTRAVIVLALWHTLQSQSDTSLPDSGDECDKLLMWLNLPSGEQRSQSCLFILLVFVVSGQDNSLALWHYDKLTHSIGRVARLLGLGKLPADEALITLMYQLKALTGSDWLLILPQISERADRVIDTLYTALLYDGKISQTDYDVLSLLALMWGVAVPDELL